MSIRIEIFDGATPLLEKIQLLSHGMALECLSVAGSKLQKEARASMRRKQHKWQQEVKNGKRRIFIGESRELGLRISHKTGAIENPDSMSHMITSNLMEKSMTVVVGGRHKSFIPNLRKDGIVFDEGDRVNAVSKKTHAILHKMNFGGSLEDQLEDYGRNPENSIFKNPRYVGYDFMNEGYNNAKSSIEDAMTKRYSRLLHKAVNRADIKMRKRA